jgi:broad specificity phosphatase PhoE
VSIPVAYPIDFETYRDARHRCGLHIVVARHRCPATRCECDWLIVSHGDIIRCELVDDGYCRDARRMHAADILRVWTSTGSFPPAGLESGK